jgi:hypothetical protein
VKNYIRLLGRNEILVSASKQVKTSKFENQITIERIEIMIADAVLTPYIS